MINEIFVIVALFVLSNALSLLILFLAQRKQWFDIPNARSSHSQPTPKCGGIAFIITFYVALLYYWKQGLIEIELLLVLALGVIIAILGLVDDIKNLNIKTRIGVQLTCVLLGLFLLDGAPPLPILSMELNFGWLGIILTALIFTWFINLYNFMDGIDGLTSIETIFVCLAAGFFCWQNNADTELLLLLSLLISVSGFLLINWPPAKIFMGDVGSNFLGLILGLIALITIQNGVLTIWTWSILLAVFVIDSTGTLLQRFRSGEVWYYAHRSHFYQIAALKFSSHSKVDLGLIIINCSWLFPLAWVSVKFPGLGLFLMLVAYIPIGILGVYYKSKIQFTIDAKP